jgi:predicted O-methyltransferase YrrM
MIPRDHLSQKLKNFLKTSAIGRIILIPYRLNLAFSYYHGPVKNIFSWLITSREHTNFTYDLDDLNKEYLASFIAVVTNTEVSKIKGYIAELEQDERLKSHIAELTASSKEKYVADASPRYGRRLGWYACVRAKKPKLVVETGVDKGLGSCVIAAALMKNEEEGFEGYMYGTDINPQAGYLLQEPYNRYGQVLYGDSIETLKGLSERIDIFINDSDHSAEYEMREYETIKGKLAEDAIILGDNAHCTRKLLDFATTTNRSFLFFQERPKSHWYPGGGIGAAFRKND